MGLISKSIIRILSNIINEEPAGVFKEERKEKELKESIFKTSLFISSAANKQMHI